MGGVNPVVIDQEFFVVPGEMATPWFEQTDLGCQFIFYVFLNGMTEDVSSVLTLNWKLLNKDRNFR